MPEGRSELSVIILAGGEATRLPGKLSLDAGERPMLARVYRNVSPGRATVISGKGPLPYELAALIDAPVIVDRWPLRGPLSGLLSTMSELRTAYAFAVAGDAPFIDAAFIDRLDAHREAGDEAIVPYRVVDGTRRIEPLAAIYAREAFVREGLPVLLAGNGALRAVIDRLRTRYVAIDDERVFANVNTPADYAAVRKVLA
jgi:molybdopterin-guanine dinucleotide biosynthesis protein A